MKIANRPVTNSEIAKKILSPSVEGNYFFPIAGKNNRHH
jgi:hypothetical protein